MIPLTFSRATLQIRRGGGEHERRSTAPYLIHQAVADLFGDREDRGYLFRIVGEWSGGANVLLLSDRPPIPLDELASPPHRCAVHIESKPFAPQLDPGSWVDFEIRLNATAVVTDAVTGKKQRTDVWEAIWRRNKQTSSTPHEVYGDYIRRKLGGVAEVLEARITERGEVRAQSGHRHNTPRFVTANAIGTLLITEPDGFLEVLSTGIGRAKAFGCGLLCLSRPGSILTRRHVADSEMY